ncbi:hypothetical protein BS78_06G077700 [Paspalum vaginatum]|nr:hypothetical protein BS78_06G077700 [Paspalum vaginatum]
MMHVTIEVMLYSYHSNRTAYHSPGFQIIACSTIQLLHYLIGSPLEQHGTQDSRGRGGVPVVHAPTPHAP